MFKDESLTDLVMAVQAAKSGATFYSNAAQARLREHMKELEQENKAGSKDSDSLINLSIREMEVFPLLADGLSVREIADRLCISPKTVETHKYNIMEKLGIESIAGLTKLAIRKSLIKA
jgi:DNA-binding NarL/FixJ family response regulator